MKEFAEYFERLYPEESSKKIIANAFNAYIVEGHSDEGQNRIITLGKKRIGREIVRSTVDRRGVHGHHFIYFFDWIDPEFPETRWGIETERNWIRFYTVPVNELRQDATYVSRLTPAQIDYFIHFLNEMPKGPGDIRFNPDLQ